MNNCEYSSPASADEALTLLRRPGAKLLAGGQSLPPLTKLGAAEPAALVSLARIGEVQGIRAEDTALWIGAATTHAQVHDSSVVRERIAALADLAGEIGDPQVRNRGTLGGSLAHNDPGADYPAAVL